MSGIIPRQLYLLTAPYLKVLCQQPQFIAYYVDSYKDKKNYFPYGDEKLFRMIEEKANKRASNDGESEDGIDFAWLA